MSEEVPELPEWVKTLIDEEKGKSYYKGRDDGIRFAMEKAVDSMTSLLFRLS